MNRKRLMTLLLLITPPIGLASGALAGDLNPPAGPVAGTMKTLTQVEPRTPVSTLTSNGEKATYVVLIDQPGSYYLDENVQGQSGKDGIRIQADNVTLDLNGYAVIGVSGTKTGIYADVHKNIVIRNGTVSDWGRHGVYLLGSTGGTVDRVHVRNCGYAGIYVGDSFVVSHCTADGNGTAGSYPHGIITDNYCTVIGCTAQANNQDGINSAAGCAVSNCTAGSNGRYGIYVFGSNVNACTVVSNSTGGIWGSHSLIHGNCAHSNNDNNFADPNTNCTFIANHDSN